MKKILIWSKTIIVIHLCLLEDGPLHQSSIQKITNCVCEAVNITPDKVKPVASKLYPFLGNQENLDRLHQKGKPSQPLHRAN